MQLEQLLDALSALDQPDQSRAHAAGSGALELRDEDPVEHPVGVRGLLASLEEEAVAGGDRERRHLRQHVGARLEDDEKDADRHRLLLEHEAVGELHVTHGAPQRVLLVGE